MKRSLQLSLLTAVLLFSASVGEAGLINRTYSYSNGNTIDATENNTNENTLYTEINGNLDSANIEDGTLTASDLSDNTITGAKINTSNFVVTLPSITVTGFNATVSTIAALSMNNAKIVNLSSGTAASDATRYSQTKILQVRTFTVSATSATAVTGQAVAWPLSNLQGTITPLGGATSKFLLTATFIAENGTASGGCRFDFTRGNSIGLAGNNGLIQFGNDASAGGLNVPIHLQYQDSPATASAITYAIAFGTNGTGTCTLNESVNYTSVLTILEVNEI